MYTRDSLACCLRTRCPRVDTRRVTARTGTRPVFNRSVAGNIKKSFPPLPPLPQIRENRIVFSLPGPGVRDYFTGRYVTPNYPGRNSIGTANTQFPNGSFTIRFLGARVGGVGGRSARHEAGGGGEGND